MSNKYSYLVCVNAKIAGTKLEDDMISTITGIKQKWIK